MVCRKEDLRLERRSISDALLLTTMCFIGMPVDVHAADGSVYSGIFHTACVDKEYDIVLKNATLVKKGDLDANVVDGAMIGTLVVRSEDLVQVVVKGVVLPAYAEVLKPNGPKEKNGLLYQPRQAADGLQKIQSDFSLGQRTIISVDETQGSSPSIRSFEAQSTNALNIPEGTVHKEPNGVSSGCSSALVNQDRRRPTTDETPCMVASPPDVSDASISIHKVKSDSGLSASSDPFLWVPPKISCVKKTAKESKLNCGAQRFYPSMLYHRHVCPDGASVSYNPGTLTLASMGNGHGGNTIPYFGTIVGVHPPFMYNGQYQSFQTEPAYVHPNSHNVMFVRGPLLYANPIPSNAQPAAPHQLYLREQQGNRSSHQHVLVANGNQPYVMPSPISKYF